MRIRRRLPRSARVGIGAGERVTAWAPISGQATGSDAALVATNRALYDQAAGVRYPWDQVSRANWMEPVLEIVVGDSGLVERRRWSLDTPGSLPDAVHAQVTSSVVVSERLDLGQGQGALAVARRSSDGDAIRWSVVFDTGLEPSDPDVRARADEALGALRTSLGI